MKNRLKLFREGLGMTQEELAKKTGISRATISKIENNEEVSVKTQTIAKISKALDANPSSIFFL